MITREVVADSEDGSATALGTPQGVDGPGGLIRPTAVEMVTRPAASQVVQRASTRNASFAGKRYVCSDRMALNAM